MAPKISWYSTLVLALLLAMSLCENIHGEAASSLAAGSWRSVSEDMIEQPCEEIYVVREGETLNSISEKCGDPFIVEENPHINDPDDVFPGLVIKITPFKHRMEVGYLIDGFSLTQTKFAKEPLEALGLQRFKPVVTPLPLKFKLSNDTGVFFDDSEYYMSLVGKLNLLTRGNIGASKLALQKFGFSFPAYSDSSKVAYVLQGSGVAGIVLPEKDEKVIPIKKGDAIALPFGVVTWWYNKEDTELVVLFLGDTSKAHIAGRFTDFFLTGTNGIFTGFSTEFISRAWDLDEKTVNTLVGNQPGSGIVKLDGSSKMPEPKSEHRKGMVLNCEEAPLDVDIKDGGRVVVLNTKNLPLVGEVGLGADLVRLDSSAMCSPGYSCDSALQVTYIVRGSGLDGRRRLETTVKEGQLFIVPRFFVVSKIADPSGMAWFSIITTPNPIFTHLAGKTSAWKALSPEVLQAAFKVSADIEKQFRSRRTSDAIFFPPSK